MSWTSHVNDRGAVGEDDLAAAPPVFARRGVDTTWSEELHERYNAAAWAQLKDMVAPGTGGAPLAGYGQRLGSLLLEAVLIVSTLFVGWLVWAFITFSYGQTPAKSILGLRVIKARTGIAADWGTMLLRTVVVSALVFAIVRSSFFGLPALLGGALIFVGSKRQTAWDRLFRTVVVTDKEGASVPPGR
jgi:uncharacterized RDD family membrane protein YckC